MIILILMQQMHKTKAFLKKNLKNIPRVEKYQQQKAIRSIYHRSAKFLALLPWFNYIKQDKNILLDCSDKVCWCVLAGKWNKKLPLQLTDTSSLILFLCSYKPHVHGFKINKS